MTNSRMTDPEVMEMRFPVIVEEFSIRAGSGGKGGVRCGMLWPMASLSYPIVPRLLYGALLLPALPLLTLHLLWRSLRQPAYRRFFGERLGRHRRPDAQTGIMGCTKRPRVAKVAGWC